MSFVRKGSRVVCGLVLVACGQSGSHGFFADAGIAGSAGTGGGTSGEGGVGGGAGGLAGNGGASGSAGEGIGGVAGHSASGGQAGAAGSYPYVGNGLVVARSVFDATVSFGFAQAIGVFYESTAFDWSAAASGECREIFGSKGGGSWIGDPQTFSTQSPPSFQNVGASISLSGSSSFDLVWNDATKQYASAPAQNALATGTYQLTLAGGGAIPSYAGPCVEMLAPPAYAASFGELTIDRSKPWTLSYQGPNSGDLIVVDLFSHGPSWTPGQTTGTTEIVCSFPDTGSISVPQVWLSKLIAGGSGQAELVRVSTRVRQLGAGAAILCVGLQGFYFNASYY